MENEAAAVFTSVTLLAGYEDCMSLKCEVKLLSRTKTFVEAGLITKTLFEEDKNISCN